ncbi:MAG: Uma2 family endonuclease [Gemmatimonadota bacterium]
MPRDPHASDASEGTLLTIEEFERLPDDGWRCELVRGRVVREPPAGFEHGRLAMRIGLVLGRFVEEHRLGEVLASETGFVLFEELPTVRAPDAAFVAEGRVPSPAPPGFGRLAPDLAVEVVSPSNTVAEIHSKVMDYLDAGSRLVWVVDPRTRSVTVYRSRKEIRLLNEDDELDGEDVLPGFRVGLKEIFEERR